MKWIFDEIKTENSKIDWIFSARFDECLGRFEYLRVETRYQNLGFYEPLRY